MKGRFACLKYCQTTGIQLVFDR